MLDRRLFLAGSAAFLAGCVRPAAPNVAASLETIRASLGPGARLGLFAIDTRSGRSIGFDQDSLYSMASTFKLPLAGAILAEVELGRMRLDEEIAFEAGEPLGHSPIVVANLARGRLPVETLCAAIIEQSDNSAANLLLKRIGGPEGLTRFLRLIGDNVTRLDRFELELNSNLPGDPRDTTNPRAMAETTEKLLLGNVLSGSSRSLLARWLRNAVPGPDRLKAGLPQSWVFGHKTGTGARGAVNDVGVAAGKGTDRNRLLL